MTYELTIRVANPNLWAIKGKAAGFLVEGEDDEGNMVLKPAKGLSIYELPDVVLVKAPEDQDGNETAPAVLAPQKHFNIDVWGEPALTAFETFYDDAVANNQIAQNNKSEVGYRWQGLEVIDPETINTKVNRWQK